VLTSVDLVQFRLHSLQRKDRWNLHGELIFLFFSLETTKVYFILRNQVFIFYKQKTKHKTNFSFLFFVNNLQKNNKLALFEDSLENVETHFCYISSFYSYRLE
jgi:hypothetical protein